MMDRGPERGFEPGIEPATDSASDPGAGGDAESLSAWMAGQPASSVRLLFTDDVPAAMSVVTERARARSVVVVTTLSALPPVDRLTRHLVEVLAEAARARWPAWYGGRFSQLGTLDDEIAAPRQIAAAIAAHDDVLQRWLDDARTRARAGQRPVFADLHPALQVRQLALALDGDQLRVVVVLQPASYDVLGLEAVGRALEWFAAHTRARAIGVLPAELASHEGLDRVGYGARTIRFSVPEVRGAPPEEPIAVVHPVIGRPHPLSRVERHMAQMLGRAEDLRTLFEFNQRIETARGSHAIVDLVWREGRVIVEIDGWDTHGNRGAFASDRHRDYELVLSGYLILRLTNEEVLSDAALAVDKIRDVVRFRRIEKGAQ